MSVTLSKSIEQMKAEREPGHCIGCNKELPKPKPGRKGKPKLDWCGSKGCKRLYQQLYHADYRHAGFDTWLEKRRKKQPAKEPK